MNDNDTTPTPTAPTTTDDRWVQWARRWDAQQSLYIEQRERRYEVMFSFLDHFVPGDIRVLDLACGPGAISARLLRQRQGSTAVALDVDPVLLELGKRAYGYFDGRLRWVEADLRIDDWHTALGGEPFDAVLSSTATHWLAAPALAAMYRRLALLLRPGGVVINGDQLKYAAHQPIIQQAVRAEDARRQGAAASSGAETWDDWWDALRLEPELAAAFAVRDHLFPEHTADELPTPGLAFHEQAVLAAGFADVGVVWQDLEERVLIAVR